jgi:hypothetical protein
MSTLDEWEDVIIQGKGLCAPFFVFGMSLQPNQSLDTGAYKFWNAYRNVGIPNIIGSRHSVSGFIPSPARLPSKALNSKELGFELESICQQEKISKYGYAHLVPMAIAFLCVLLHTARYKFRVVQREFCSSPNTAFPSVICLVSSCLLFSENPD